MRYTLHSRQTQPGIRPAHPRTQLRSAINTLVATGALLLTGFAHAEKSQTSEPAKSSLTQFSPPQDTIQNLLNYARNYEGVPYRRGGINPTTGFDCSGFVRFVFDRAEGISLPHHSGSISQIGNPVALDELKPGDLVFFYLLQKTVSHVGIYLGNNQFIHASSNRSGSVVVSSLKENYWSQHYISARRIDTTMTNSSTRITLANNQQFPALQLENRLHDFAND
jgi:cell wall-associated NlpC family hydrolase